MGDDIVDLERGLIAAALTQPRAVVSLGDEAGLTGLEFSRRSLGDAWTVIVERVAAGHPVDPVLVAADLRLPDHEGRLRDLQIDHATALSAVPEYVRRVRTAAAARRARLFAAELAADGVFDGADHAGAVAELVAARFEQFQASVTGESSSGGRRIGQAIRELLLPDIDRRRAGEHETFQTGFHDLDEVVSIEPGNVVAVIARPGVGKSMFILQLASNLAEAARPTYIATLEMSELEVGRRVAAAVSGVPLSLMSKPQDRYTDEHHARVVRAADKADDWPLWVDDRAQTLERIVATARLHARAGLRIVVVDYWQLVESSVPLPPNGRREFLELVSRRLKLLAQELGLVVVLAAQVNREAKDRPPLLSDIRESGALEQDANIVLGLHKGVLEDGATVDGHAPLEVEVLKNRDGPTTKIELSAGLHNARISNMRGYG